jgi:ABC-type multidrug transport system fused ATPase/permease subunit
MSDWDNDKLEKKDRNLKFFVKGMRTLWELLGKERKNIMFVFWLLVFTQAMEIVFSYCLKLIFDFLPGFANGVGVVTYLYWVLAAMAGAKLLGLLVRHFVKEIIFVNAVIRLENLWPVQAQKKLLELPMGYHERENTGKKISKINKGVDRLVDILTTLFWGTLPQLLYLIINVVVAIVIDWRLGILFCLPFIPAMILHFRIFDRYADGWELWEAKKEESTGKTCQSIICVNTVQNFVQEKTEIGVNQVIRDEMVEIDTTIHTEMQKSFFYIGCILQFFFFLTIALGVYLVYLGKSTPGTIVYLIATGSVTLQGIGDIMMNYTRTLRRMISVQRMKDLLDEKSSIENSESAIVPTGYEGEFSFSDVTFTYPGKDKPVLHDFSLTVSPKEMVALVGRSGEGKSTVIRLLCRMYDIDSGEISLDGQTIKEINLDWYRKLFAIVQQDVDIFDATLLGNVRYPYPEATEEQVQEALQAAHLDVILDNKERFPEGIQTQVGERGIRLSGGEKQRVGIARAYLALLNGAKILVLDEATSSLDSEAEQAIQQMIDRVQEKLNISIVAIAHRLSTIQKADKICVINDGRVVESGDHHRLVARNGLYAKLVELQKLGALRD